MIVPVIGVACREFKMKNTLFSCALACKCVEASIRRLVSRFSNGTQNTVNQTGAFYFSQACSENVFNSFQKQTNDSHRFISELMDVFLMAGVHQQPEQSNYLAEGQN